MGVRRKFTLIAVLVLTLVGCVAPRRAEAQFIGYISPQSVNNTLATNQVCNGGTQTYTTGVTANFQNLGQTQHTLSVTTGGSPPQFFQAAIFGIDKAGNSYQISDSMRLAAFQSNASLYARGYFPQIQIKIACSSGTTYTASYAGSSSDSGPMLGSSQLAQLAKPIANVIPANQNFTDNLIQTPFGNTAGLLQVALVGASLPAGSTVTITCTSQEFSWPVDTIALGTSVASPVQNYPIPPANCPLISVTYTSGGASVSSLSIEYDFIEPGHGTQQAIYGPIQLGVNALTEPAAGTSALSTIVDTRNAKEGTLDFSCTAGAISVNVQTYNDDGIGTASLVTPLTAVAAGTKTQLYIGSEANDSASGGTISSSAFVRFPQRALAFSFTNAGGAGTCTARLYLSY